MNKRVIYWAICICFVGSASSLSFGQQESWVPRPNPPGNATAGGYISDTPNPVDLCEVGQNNNLHPDKTAYYDGRWSCFIGYGGAEQKIETYEVLLKEQGGASTNTDAEASRRRIQDNIGSASEKVQNVANSILSALQGNAPSKNVSAIGSSADGQTNLALHKTSTQSSTILPPNGASVCVDGNRASGWCHTNSEPNPWWQVDLGGSYALSQIVVYNRADEYGAREATIGAMVSSDGSNWARIYSHDGSNFQVLRINAGNRTARYVRLQLAGTDYLNLLEVEVYGTGSAQPGAILPGGAASAPVPAKQEPANSPAQAAQDTIPAVVSSSAVPYDAEETAALDSLVQSFDAADASLVMEGLRILAGDKNPEVEQNLSKTLAPYFILPSESTREDLAKILPLLVQTVEVEGAEATSTAAFDSAWEEAVMAASIESEEGTRVGLSLAAQHKAELESEQARLVKIAQQVKSLSNQRDPVQERKKLQVQHQKVMKTMRQVTGVTKPAATSAAASEGSWAYRLIKSEVPPAIGGTSQEVAHEGAYSANGNEMTWRYNYNDDGGAHQKTLRWRVLKAIFPERPTEFWIGGDASGNTWMQGCIKVDYQMLNSWTAGLKIVPGPVDWNGQSNLEDHYSLTFPNVNTFLAEIKQGKKPSWIMNIRANGYEMPSICESGNGADSFMYKGTPSSVPEEQLLAVDTRGIESQVPLKIRVEVWCPGRDVLLAAYTYEWSNGVDSSDDDLLTEASAPTDSEKSQRVQEIEANIRIIQHNLTHDEQDLAKETDSTRRAALQFRILQARSDMQAEQDLEDSIQTGQFVHTRSPFDDYAHDLFVENIRENQLKMEQFQRSSAALQRLAQLLPKGEDDIARDFIGRQLTPDDLAHLNMAKVKQIAEALDLKLEGFTKLEQAKNEEEAAMADYKLTVASNIKSTADTALMTTGIFMGGFAVKGAYSLNVLYEAGTGYSEGGWKSSVIKGVGAASYPAFLAASAFEGYRTDGWTGAGKNLALTYITGKAMQYGLSKALSVVPNKPAATVSEYISQAQFKQARERGIALVKDFQRVNDEATILAALARKGDNAAAAKLLSMEKTLQDKAAAIHGDMHAKNYLKYKGDFVSQRGFNKVVGDIHDDVQKQWHKIMQEEKKWVPTPLKEIRNSSSSGSVGMDYDIGLDQSLIKSLSKNGKPATVLEWQKEAQDAWNQAYKMVTGRSAAKSWETVTTNLHPEAYKDLAWLSGDKSGVSKFWAQQAADVTRYKSWHMANDPSLSAMEKLQEISRGTSKDITTKLLPLVQNARPGSAASAEALTEAQRHWNKINNVLDAFGKGQIDPVYTTRRIRELTGGKSISETVTDATTLMESIAKMGTPRN
jgi:hypothetical protein